MKNVLIGLDVLGVGVVGYILYQRSKQPGLSTASLPSVATSSIKMSGMLR
jgi:hypothetical protein